jgi:membrane protein YdbS with pleckstrin-like domain
MAKKQEFCEMTTGIEKYSPKDPVVLRQHITLTNFLVAFAIVAAIALSISAAVLETVWYLGAAAALAAVAAIAALKKLQFLRPFLRAEQQRHALNK